MNIKNIAAVEEDMNLPFGIALYKLDKDEPVSARHCADLFQKLDWPEAYPLTVVSADGRTTAYGFISAVRKNDLGKGEYARICDEIARVLDDDSLKSGIGVYQYEDGFDGIRIYMSRPDICTIMDPDELFEAVTKAYESNSTELSGLFFDFKVKMKKRDILVTYGELQSRINGDVVGQYKNGTFHDYSEPEFADEPEYQELYTGSCMKFLESFNGNDAFRRCNCCAEEDECEKCDGTYDLCEFVF